MLRLVHASRASVYIKDIKSGIPYTDGRRNYVRKGSAVMFELNFLLGTKGRSNKQKGSTTSALSIFAE